MPEDIKQVKLMYFSMAYGTNINYLIVLLMLVFYLDLGKNQLLAIIIWLIPAFISSLISTLIINHHLSNNLSRQSGVLSLAIAHIPSLLGLMSSLIYLFIL